MNPTPALGAPVQIAYAVPDARAAAQTWAEQCGAGPFFLSEHIPVTDVVYRGRPSEFDHTSAYGQWGALMVELVQDHGSGPSAVRELYAPDEGGLHHMAFMVDDLDLALTELESQGMGIAMDAMAGTTRFVFVDALDKLGHFIELYEKSPPLESFYAMVADTAKGWDGTDPVRSR